MCPRVKADGLEMHGHCCAMAHLPRLRRSDQAMGEAKLVLRSDMIWHLTVLLARNSILA